MKFSDIERDRWEELKPFLDTAMIPLSGMTGKEQPWEATEALERLRDAMEPIEQMYKGRVVTYPAIHYSESDDELCRLVNAVSQRLRESGFRYTIVVTGSKRLSAFRPEEASLVIAPLGEETAETENEYRARIRNSVQALWSGGQG